jgi:hypothetical protein
MKVGLLAFILAVVALAAVHTGAVGAGTDAPIPKVFISYEEAKPAIEATRPDLPEELARLDADALAKAWPEWVKKRDAEIRARLEQGDEDTLINLLLFGTSFTRAPRVTQENLTRLAPQAQAASSDPQLQAAAPWIAARIEDLLTGAAAPGANQHLAFARGLLRLQGMDPGSPQGKAKGRTFLQMQVNRVLSEQESYRQVITAARELNDPFERMMQRATLYRQRGLSLDSSLSPQFGLQRSFQELKDKGVFAPGSVHHVAIIGPGLDFTDKSSGYDFYPPQSIQPFAVMDGLLHSGLAAGGDLDVVTLDLSARVNEHLLLAARHARQASGYTVELPLPGYIPWSEGILSYWREFGSQIAAPVAPAAVPPEAGDVRIRAVRVRPKWVLRVRPLDVNAVLERPAPGAGLPPFDVVIATNILVYYGVFEQSLALTNISRTLRPGGILLTNDALLEIPAIPMRPIGHTAVVYSNRPDDGDHIIWFQALATQQ